MKKKLLAILVIAFAFGLFGCQPSADSAQIVATTRPVFEFTEMLCDGTDLRVAQLITESTSCLHDYTLQVSQMRLIENADHIVISGAGFEDFIDSSILNGKSIIDSSAGIDLICPDGHTHDDHKHGHSHDVDPHIWLSPVNAKTMVSNIYAGLVRLYPGYEAQLSENLNNIQAELDALIHYASAELENLESREIITFHDGFAYMARDFGLSISEASAAELITLASIIKEHNLSAVFVESNSASTAATVIAGETGTSVFALDMGLGSRNYFDAIYHNIDTIKEALR